MIVDNLHTEKEEEWSSRRGIFAFVMFLAIIGLLLGCRQSIDEEKKTDEQARISSSFVMRSISSNEEENVTPFQSTPFSEEVAAEQNDLVESFRTGGR